MEFRCVTAGTLLGRLAERGRMLPATYCAWGLQSWAFKRDFTGEDPVEIGSDVSGLAFARVLERRQETELLDFRPHNVS